MIYHARYNYGKSCGSTVGIATGYGMDDWGGFEFESR
jgi:hypothetical protein